MQKTKMANSDKRLEDIALDEGLASSAQLDRESGDTRYRAELARKDFEKLSLFKKFASQLRDTPLRMYLPIQLTKFYYGDTESAIKTGSYYSLLNNTNLQDLPLEEIEKNLPEIREIYSKFVTLFESHVMPESPFRIKKDIGLDELEKLAFRLYSDLDGLGHNYNLYSDRCFGFGIVNSNGCPLFGHLLNNLNQIARLTDVDLFLRNYPYRPGFKESLDRIVLDPKKAKEKAERTVLKRYEEFRKKPESRVAKIGRFEDIGKSGRKEYAGKIIYFEGGEEYSIHRLKDNILFRLVRGLMPDRRAVFRVPKDFGHFYHFNIEDKSEK